MRVRVRVRACACACVCVHAVLETQAAFEEDVSKDTELPTTPVFLNTTTMRKQSHERAAAHTRPGIRWGAGAGSRARNTHFSISKPFVYGRTQESCTRKGPGQDPGRHLTI